MKLKIYLTHIISLFLFASSGVSAQGLCNVGGGNFDITPIEGCAPLTVKITNKVPNTSIVGYNAEYDRASQNPTYANYPSYTYVWSGEYTILQYGAVSTGAFSLCKQVKVYETRPVNLQYSSCGGGKIKLILTNDFYLAVYDQHEIKWGDGTTEIWKKGDSLTLEHNYANTATSPIITVKGIYTSNKVCTEGSPLTVQVSFQQAQLSNIGIESVEMTGLGTIRINYQGLTSIPTSIQYNTSGNSYVTHGSRSSGGLQPYEIKGLNKNQSYQIRLSSKDLCNSQLETTPITSMTLSGKSENGKTILSWNKYGNPDGFTEYNLLRDGTIIKTSTSINDITYTDEDVECGTYSEYQLIAKTKGATSTSAPVGIKAEVSASIAIEKASVTVNGNNNVTISAVVPGAGGNSTYDLSIEKAETGTTTFKKITTLYNESQYTDIDVKANEMSYCYRLTYQNSCGQKLPPTEPICTIMLKNDLSSFTWTTQKPFLDAIASYDVLQKGNNGSNEEIGRELNNNFMPILNKQSSLQYTFQVRANSSSSNFQSFSNIVDYKRNAGVFVPDAFSPNGDGLNDELLAKSAQLQSFSFSVLNRWGETVFHSDDITVGWDGNINGENAPVGFYVYKVSFVDDINQKVDKSGTFMLLR